MLDTTETGVSNRSSAPDTTQATPATAARIGLRNTTDGYGVIAIGLHWLVLPDPSRRNWEFLPEMVESVTVNVLETL